MATRIQRIRSLETIGFLAGMISAAAVRAAPPNAAPSTASRPPAAGGSLLAEALKGPLAGVEAIVFGVSQPFGGSFAPFGPECRNPAKLALRKGAQLGALNLRTGKITVLLEDRAGELRDIHVNYDGKRALFAYGKGGTIGIHIYEIRLDGTGLTRITPDDIEQDISPTYLPNNDIVFCSTRSHRYVGCASSYATTLFRCRADGSGLMPISASLEIERGVSVLADGRLIFLHWEYYHRGTHGFHPLYTCNPDGTGLAVAYGNMHPDGYNWWPETPRQMPEIDRIVFVLGPNRPFGTITFLDPNLGPDTPAAIRKVPGSAKEARDPSPLGGEWILAASGDGMVLMDGKGRNEILYTLDTPCLNGKDYWLVSPHPIRPRPREPVIPDRVNLTAATGTFLLTDVTQGRNMDGVKPGDIKRLLVLEWLPTPIGPIWPTVRAAWFLNRILGTVPVEADGSAYFEAPAMRAYAFVALDERGLAVKHMQSAAHIMPGEVAGCVGCHEPRTQPSSAGKPVLATRRPPSRIEPFDGIPDRLDYLEDVQPIWDRHCVKCHNPDNRGGGVLMTADRGGGANHTSGLPHSHLSLMAAGQIMDCRGPNQWGNIAPRHMGSGASPLMRKLDGSHHEVKVSPREWSAAALWVDTMIPFRRYYGEQTAEPRGAKGVSPGAMAVIERRCFTCHEKHPPRREYCGAHMFPGFRSGEEGHNYLFYPEANPSHESDIRVTKAKTAEEHERQFQEAFGRNEAQLRRGAAILVNWDRPEKSLILLAPLAKAAGGYATASMDDVKSGKMKSCPVLFQKTDDPDYKAILAGLPRMPPSKPDATTNARWHLTPRFQEYGLLPATLKPNDTFDRHRLWEQYWESLWWKAPSDARAKDPGPTTRRRDP